MLSLQHRQLHQEQQQQNRQIQPERITHLMAGMQEQQHMILQHL